MNAVAASPGADIDYGVADTFCLTIEDLLAPDDSEGEGIDEGIERVALVEVDLTADRWDAKGIAVMAESLHDAGHDSTIAADTAGAGHFAHFAVWRDLLIANRSEAQTIHGRDRSRPHREDVTQDAADARRRSLVGFDKGGMIVRLDLESGTPAISDLDDACILPRPLNQALSLGREAAQVNLG